MINTSVKRRRIWEWSYFTPWLLGALGGVFLALTKTVLPTWIHHALIAFGMFLVFTYLVPPHLTVVT